MARAEGWPSGVLGYRRLQLVPINLFACFAVGGKGHGHRVADFMLLIGPAA